MHIFNFLEELSKNNNKEWFDSHQDLFLLAKEEATHIFNEIYNHVAAQDYVSDMKIYRIYRDLRFSKDKTPYKTHFGLYFQRQQPQYRGGYYVHLGINECFVGGGFFNPNKEDLLRIRQEIAAEADAFKAVMESEGIVREFDGKLFGDEVKTAPKGFDKNDPMIAYLRKKQFLLKRDFSRAEVEADNFVARAADVLLAMRPFYDFMTEALFNDYE